MSYDNIMNVIVSVGMLAITLVVCTYLIAVMVIAVCETIMSLYVKILGGKKK